VADVPAFSRLVEISSFQAATEMTILVSILMSPLAGGAVLLRVASRESVSLPAMRKFSFLMLFTALLVGCALLLASNSYNNQVSRANAVIPLISQFRIALAVVVPLSAMIVSAISAAWLSIAISLFART
jgi:hypothetical protein